MTEVSEGEYEVINKSVAGDSDDIKIDPNENDSTFDGITGEEEEQQQDKASKPPSPPAQGCELMAFLTKHDLTDIHLQIASSKLTLSHLVKASLSDLDDLCNDLKLDSSQKIRLKHAVKSSQSKRRRIKHKIRAKASLSKQKLKSKKKRSLRRKKR